MFKPLTDKQIVLECLNQNKSCNAYINCSADQKSWEIVENRIKSGIEFVDELEMYYKIKGKRLIYEQSKKNKKLQIFEAELLSLLHRY